MKYGGYSRTGQRVVTSDSGRLSEAKDQTGFTIIEVLIVLTVSSILLVSAIILLNGRQAKTAFLTGKNDLKQQFQQVINESAKGFYPNNDAYKCDGSGAQVQIVANGMGAQHKQLGTNDGCIFLGEIMQFNTSGNTFDLVPVVGKQYAGSGLSSSSLSQTVPVAATQLKQPRVMNSGLKFVSATADGNAVNSKSVAFLVGDNTGRFATVASDGLASGTQIYSLYQVTNDNTNATSTLDSFSPGQYLSNASQVALCFDGGSGQSALLTIGGNGGLAVSDQVFNNGTCSP